jgi:hypothetical protein
MSGGDVGGSGDHRPVPSSNTSPAARALAVRVSASVSAAQLGDADAFALLAPALDGSGAHHVDTVLSSVTRALLEELHPDGLESDDIRGILGRLAVEALDWYPAFDMDALLVTLAGALGVAEAPGPSPFATSDPDGSAPDGIDSTDSGSDEPTALPPTETVLRRHAVLLVADLCTVSGSSAPRQIASALAEIERAETQEMP